MYYTLLPLMQQIQSLGTFQTNFNLINLRRDAVIVPMMNCGTSFYAGFVIFSIIGFLAHEANLPVDQVITSGKIFSLISLNLQHQLHNVMP